MMTFGSHNGGRRSSSSSSNLSPLAPPFTLDKSYHKQQHNSNSSVNCTEQPYTSCFDRPRTVWTPSTNSPFGPYITENSSKDGNFSSSEVHGFLGSQLSNSSSSARLVPLDSAAGKGYDGFPYGQYSNSIPSSLVEAKPYYPPFVAADDHSGVAHSEPSYDLLSNFGTGQLSGSSQVDGTQAVSSVDYTPKWSGLWNGLNDIEQGNWLGLGGNFGSKDYKPSDPSNCHKFMKIGSVAADDHYDFQAGTLPIESLGSYVGTSIKPANCFDDFGGDNSFGFKGLEDRKSLKEPKQGPTTISNVRVSAFGSTSTCNENLHPQDPFMQAPLPQHFGIYDCPLDSQDKQTNCTDSYVFDSTSTLRSSPASMIKTSLGGFPPAQDALRSITVNAMNNEAVDEVEKSADFLPYHPFGLNCRVSDYRGKTDNLFTKPSFTNMEDNLDKKRGNDDCLNQLLKTKSVSPIPHLSVTDCLKIKSNTAETLYSMEKLSDGLDMHNPAEDSPCWKGAPASRFSPFDDSKVVISDVVLEKSESRFNSDGEEHKNSLPIGLVTTDAIHVPGEVAENTSSKRSSDASFVSRECDGPCSVKQKLHSGKLYGGDGFQSLDKKLGLDLGIGNDFCLSNDSEVASTSKSSQSLQINSEGCEVVAEEKLASAVAARVPELKGKCADVPSSDGLSCAPSKAGDQLLLSPSRNASASKVGQLSVKDSNSRVDISVLVNAMKNLSEALVSHCLNSHETPTELDHAAVKHIIHNLNSCLVKDPLQGTSCLEGAKQVQMVRTVMATHTGQHDLDNLEAWKRDIFCNRNKGLLGSLSENNTATVRDADTIQAIKRVLDMNFPSEEMQPETVLYKNLWLEAEAALCDIAVRSRFYRMRMEMKKREHGQKNGEEIPKASDVNKVAEPLHEANNALNSIKDSYPTDLESSVIARFRTLRSVVEDLKSTKPVGRQEQRKESHRPSLNTEAHHIPTFDCPSVSPQSHPNDFEATVMARFQTLKSRADNSDLLNTEDGNSASRENFGPPSPEHSIPPSPEHSIQDSYFSSIAAHKDDTEASVMSRFHILKSRIEQSGSLDMDSQQQPVQPDGPTLTSFFSRSVVQPQGENVKDCSGASMSSNPGNKPCKFNGLGDELLEGWYDCSESGWEHVMKDGSPKQN